MIKAKKESVTSPQLGMFVFHESIYKGRELMKVVGIRYNEVELQGDYSGGTHNVIQKDWLPINGLFMLRKICMEELRPGGCQLPNVHCGAPECSPYIYNWGHYINGTLVDEVELIQP